MKHRSLTLAIAMMICAWLSVLLCILLWAVRTTAGAIAIAFGTVAAIADLCMRVLNRVVYVGVNGK
jgi:predicted secreted protein